MDTIELLNKDFLKNAGLIENLNHEQCEVLYQDENCVLILPEKSQIYMVSCTSENAVNSAIAQLNSADIFFCCDSISAKAVCNKFGFKNMQECYQVVYQQNEKVKLNDVCQIKKLELNDENVRFVTKHYTLNYSSDQVEYLIKNVGLYGAYYQGRLVGFIGRHEERSMGLLEVLPEFRKLGIGYELEGYLINDSLDKNYIPYAHIRSENYKSMNLQKKLGFTIYEKMVYWCF